MPEKLPANAPWKYDYVPQYNLDERIVNDYLKSIWGNYKYFIERSGDEFRFWVPRKLHKHEQDELFKRRTSTN